MLGILNPGLSDAHRLPRIGANGRVGSGSGSATYTFTDIDIGASHKGRGIVAIALGNKAPFGGSIAGATIGGKAMIRAANNTDQRAGAVFHAEIPEGGTTATLVIDAGPFQQDIVIGYFLVTGFKLDEPVFAASVGAFGSGSTSASRTISVPENGIAFFGVSKLNNAEPTFSSPSGIIGVGSEAAAGNRAGFATFDRDIRMAQASPSGTDFTFTANWSGGQAGVAAALSFARKGTWS